MTKNWYILCNQAANYTLVMFCEYRTSLQLFVQARLTLSWLTGAVITGED